jgi:hypothetical protein
MAGMETFNRAKKFAAVDCNEERLEKGSVKKVSQK